MSARWILVLALCVTTGAWETTREVRLGPDGNACGITAPSRPRGKPGMILWFHGGMRSQNREKGLTAHQALLPFADSGSYFLCSPSAFGEEDWLSPQGMAHADTLIDYMLSHYPVDSRNINLAGVSDGCLGVIRYSQVGKREVNRRVLISSYPRLALDPGSLSAQGRFASGRWDFLQGGKDRLFPIDQVLPLLREWEKTFPNTHVHYFPEGEHDFSYYAANAQELLKTLFSKPGRKNPAPKKR